MKLQDWEIIFILRVKLHFCDYIFNMFDISENLANFSKAYVVICQKNTKFPINLLTY